MMKFSLCVFLLFAVLLLHYAQANEEAKTYIIYLDHSFKADSFQSHEEWHRSELSSLSNPVLESGFLYSYSHVMHGFSAKLTLSQLREIESSPAHVATQEESFGQFLTTHSPRFLGLNHNSGLWPAASQGEGVIIGLLDSGVWPESRSFRDRGMPQVPPRWKGKCQNDTTLPFRCNNKLIGIQVFTRGQQAKGGYDPYNNDSPRDYLFHGTHTASTAAGNYVEGASRSGFASGTAKGVAPRSHIAMYKVGYSEQAATDVLAAMDQAVSDGVDVMSLSISLDTVPYFKDVIAMASLAAVERGVSVICSAGNTGRSSTIANGAPWITTVGAATLDRYTFAGEMTLGDGSVFQGISKFPISAYLYNVTIHYGFEDFNKSICEFGSLNPRQAAGNVVLCGYKSGGLFSLDQQIQELQRVKPIAGIVLADPILLDDYEDDCSVPIFILPIQTGAGVTEYATRVQNATVKSMRFVLSTFGRPAPSVAFYSSRGPDPINPGILKPDVIAPGSHILAAVPPFKWSGQIGAYTLVSEYLTFSGTSMAAPHVAGVVALLKAYRPHWSPAATKSAMMTSAYILDNYGSIITDQSTGLPATALDYGAGHIDPNRAMEPGLVYDIGFQDYVEYICGLGYSHKQMKSLLRRNHWKCSSKPRNDLNYPSFVAIFKNRSGSEHALRQSFRRELTKVDDGESIYRAVVTSPRGMSIYVEPSSLAFSHGNQKLEFVLTVKLDGHGVLPRTGYHGRVTWVDHELEHSVSSPVVALSL